MAYISYTGQHYGKVLGGKEQVYLGARSNYSQAPGEDIPMPMALAYEYL